MKLKIFLSILVLSLIVNAALCIRLITFRSAAIPAGAVTTSRVEVGPSSADEPFLATLEVLTEVKYTGTPITSSYPNAIHGYAYFVRTIPDNRYFIVYSQDARVQQYLPAGTQIQTWCIPTCVKADIGSFGSFAQRASIKDGQYMFLNPVDILNVIVPKTAP